MPGLNSTADSTAVPFDPYELKDVVGGTIRDPYPAMHALRRESPVHVGPDRPRRGRRDRRPHQAGTRHRLRLRRGRAGVARQRDVLLDHLRGDHGHGDGPHDPADGRARAPRDPHPRGRELPLQNARALGGGSRRPRRQRARRLLHRRRPHRPRALGHLQLPRAGHRPHPRAAPRGLPEVPALGAGAHQRRRQLGARHRGLRRAARLLRRRHGRAPGHAGRRPHQRPGAGRGRRRAPDRRGDLLLPAAAAPGRRGDDLPRHGQHAVRAPAGPRPVRRALRRPLAVRPGLRGGRALGAPGDGDSAPGDPRRRAGGGAASRRAPTSRS